MKNILNIIRHDSKKITGSVVAIITVMGLCIVPCLYAWFNIFSNWSPYESDATGRISVAVANADEGATVSGLKVNVGEKIITALEANDDIGWVFVDSEEEARKAVYAGNYYAAIVIPEDFTIDVLSFMNGNLKNPTIKYYENEKKNAIAPKITGKAKTALQEEVNATFVETLAGYVSDAASIAEAAGTDPVQMLNDLSSKADSIGRDINSCIVLSNSAAGLTSAAGNLLDVTDTLIGSSQNVLTENDRLLSDIEKRLPTRTTNIKARDAASKSAEDSSAVLEDLRAATELLAESRLAFDLFVDTARDNWVRRVDRMKSDALSQANILEAAGYSVLAEDHLRLAAKLGDISDDLMAMERGMNESQRRAVIDTLMADIEAAFNIIDEIRTQVREDINDDLATALAETRNSYAAYRNALAGANSDLGNLSTLLGKYNNSLGKLENSIDKTNRSLKSLQRGSKAVSGLLSNAAGNELLQTFSGLLANDEAAVAEYLANPVRMETKVIWPIETYGSAMAPFYTVLAQWVGALLTAVLIKVKIKKRRDLVDLKLHEWYFGRYGLYLLVGLLQALIVSLGDLFYIGIQCTAPVKFILAACVNGIVFMMINYALVFALDNIGLGAAVIVLVLQVAGSGGTYPVEVLPEPFRVLYPFMPFRYAMDAMRECIGGMYNGTYWHCLGVLMIFFVFAVCFGIALYRPALWLNNMIAESKAKSEIML